MKDERRTGAVLNVMPTGNMRVEIIWPRFSREIDLDVIMQVIKNFELYYGYGPDFDMATGWETNPHVVKLIGLTHAAYLHAMTYDLGLEGWVMRVPIVRATMPKGEAAKFCLLWEHEFLECRMREVRS